MVQNRHCNVFDRLAKRARPAMHIHSWSRKSHATFVDVLAAVRQPIGREICAVSGPT
jgi:hypothetical protein